MSSKIRPPVFIHQPAFPVEEEDIVKGISELTDPTEAVQATLTYMHKALRERFVGEKLGSTLPDQMKLAADRALAIVKNRVSVLSGLQGVKIDSVQIEGDRVTFNMWVPHPVFELDITLLNDGITEVIEKEERVGGKNLIRLSAPWRF